MPDGSSSAAPVTMPGPSIPRTFFKALNIAALPSHFSHPPLITSFLSPCVSVHIPLSKEGTTQKVEVVVQQGRPYRGVTHRPADIEPGKHLPILLHPQDV